MAQSSERSCPDWGQYMRVHARTASADCPSRITPRTAPRLRAKWSYETRRAVTASPAVVDGVVYVGDWSRTMYAVRDGKLLWERTVAAAPGASFGPIVSSAAVADVGERRLVIFGAGPVLYALDAGTGAQVWATDLGRGVPDTPVEIESSPLVHGGRVYVGMDTHNAGEAATGGVRGGLLVVDAATGAPQWTFEPELDQPGSGCGSIWSSPVLDTARDLVVVATANCPSAFTWNRHTEAVTALDATPETGAPEVVWTFQPHAPNRKDWDFGATPNLFTTDDGLPVLGAGNKDGAYYALNPATGARRWATKVALPGDVREDFSIGGFLGSPTAHRGRVFGGTAIGGPPYFHALDGKDGRIAWRGLAGPAYGTSAAVGGVVFAGALDTLFKAFDARTGRVLWAKSLLAPVASGPAISGDQVIVGSGLASSDACVKGTPIDALCVQAFEDVLGSLGGIHAFELPAGDPAAGVPGALLLNVQGNQLDVYDLAKPLPRRERLIPSAADGGLDLNAQICPFPDGRHVLLGEDTDQTLGVPQGWGILDLITRRQVGKLVTTYGSTPQPENYGCAIDTDTAGSVERIFVTQTGAGTIDAKDGQLIEFFPDSPSLDAVFGRRTPDEVCPGGDCRALRASDSRSCMLGGAFTTAGGLALEGDNVLMAETAPRPPQPGQVLRFRPPFPASPETCAPKTGEPFIRDFLAATPRAITAKRDRNGQPTGGWYVSSVLAPQAVGEYDAKGRFKRYAVKPLLRGTPFGLTVDRKGTLYVADLGVAASITPTGALSIGPGPAKGSVLRVRLDKRGKARRAEVLAEGLEFPDGLGIFEPVTSG